MQALRSWFSPVTFLWTLGMRSGHQACAEALFPWSRLGSPQTCSLRMQSERAFRKWFAGAHIFIAGCHTRPLQCFVHFKF